ncbi:MAG: succinylglutamate desuccinylase/aspartoacylase family protein, partial [Thermoanaerobaculia bacterium]|nr:succinylglutamate desuccinylase/aspartoacylase family protein [Thermoanaerobaculia bacterium]
MERAWPLVWFMEGSVTTQTTPGEAGVRPRDEIGIARAEESRSRVIDRLGSGDDGPTLICIGSVHGNEPAGTVGLRRVVEEVRRRDLAVRGEFVALVGNREALLRRVRFVDEDLNRSWSATRIAELRAGRR